MFRLLGRFATRALHALPLILCVALVCACGGSRAQAEDPTFKQVAAATARLRGTWTLMQFQPDLALEPMLAQLMAVQMGRLTIRFDGNQAFITGVGVDTQRKYRVDSADGDQLHLTLTDDSGATYLVAGQFAGDDLLFRSDTSPWRGHGKLNRAAPGQP